VGLGVAGVLVAGAVSGAVAAPYYYGGYPAEGTAPYGYYRYPYPYAGYGTGYGY
jgi:hypothetical protein